MSTVANTRPMNAPRPAQPNSAASSGGGVAIDPVRILRMYWIPLLLSVMIGAGLGIAAYMMLVRVSPRYDSAVLYEALPPSATLRGSNEGLGLRDEMERFIATQVITMTTDRILREALKKQEVSSTEWAKQFADREGRMVEADALRELKEIVGARPRIGSNLLSLTVRAAKNTDASALANAVHRSYFEDLAALKLNVTNERREPLSQTLRDLTTKVDQIDQTISRIVRTNQLEDTGQRNAMTSVEVEITNLQPRRAEALQRQAATEERLSKLQASMGGEGGVPMFTDEQKEISERDPVVLSSKQRLTEYQVSDSAMRDRGLGESHPDRARMRAMMDAIRLEIERVRSESLRKLFDADIEAAKRATDSVKQEIRTMDLRLETLKAEKTKVAQALLELENLRVTKASFVEERNSIQQSLTNLDELGKLQGATRIDRVRLVQPPLTPDELAFPSLKTTVPAGVILTLGLTLAFVVLRELLDTRIRTPADVALIRGARLLGSVPRADEDPTRPVSPQTAFRDSPTGAISEAFRQMRSPLLKKMVAGGHKTLLVVPAAPGSGASTVASNLALGAAASEMKVLLIDANLRRPSLHKVFKLAEGPGLADVLSKKCDLSMALQATSVPHLTLLAAGSSTLRSVPERLSADALTAALEEARGKFDLVIVDTAPALVAGDAQALVNRCDAAVLVVRAFGERRGQVGRLRDQLSEGRAEVLGIIVNQVRSSSGGYMRKNIQMAYDYQTVSPA